MKNKIFLIFVLLSIKINAQNKLQLEKIPSESKPWTYERANDHKGKFNFLLLLLIELEVKEKVFGKKG